MERGIQVNRRTFSTKLINSAISSKKQLKVFHILEILADETYLCFVVLLLTLMPQRFKTFQRNRPCNTDYMCLEQKFIDGAYIIYSNEQTSHYRME